MIVTTINNSTESLNKKCYIVKIPLVKNVDTRCSTRCVQNWTKYNQKIPIGHYCSCTFN